MAGFNVTIFKQAVAKEDKTSVFAKLNFYCDFLRTFFLIFVFAIVTY